MRRGSDVQEERQSRDQLGTMTLVAWRVITGIYILYFVLFSSILVAIYL